jgi:hypothetical protein
MNNGVVILEHVDFVNILERLHTELLDGGLEFLVLCNFGVVNNLLSSSLGS